MKSLDVIAIGEPLIELNQRPDQPGVYTAGFGGDTSTCVVAAARLGARCAYITQVGDDRFGRQLLELWRAEGVDTGNVRVTSGLDTGLYFVHHSAQGHEFVYRRQGSAAAHMTAQSVALDRVAHAHFLHCSGISQAIGKGPRQAVARAVTLAKTQGTRVSYDLNFRPQLWSAQDARQALLAILPACDVFFPSVDEFSALTGLADPKEIIAWSHQHGAQAVVLKLGAQGCWVSDGQGAYAVPAHAVVPVDATGAGDCFAGTCLARLAAGDSLGTAAHVANVAAALSTQGQGAIAALPRWSDLVPLVRR